MLRWRGAATQDWRTKSFVHSRAPWRKRPTRHVYEHTTKNACMLACQGPLLKTCTRASCMHLCKALCKSICAKPGSMAKADTCHPEATDANCVGARIELGLLQTKQFQINACLFPTSPYAQAKQAGYRRSDVLQTSTWHPNATWTPEINAAVVACRCRLMHGDGRSCPEGPSEGASSHHSTSAMGTE